MITTLSEAQARELLESSRLGRLGCIVDGEPYITPINYEFEDNYLYFHSLPGMKIDGLRANPHACLQVDEIESDVRWRSVIAFGEFEEVNDANERKDALGKLLKRFPMLTPVEAAIAEDGIPPEVIVARIKLSRITGVGEG